MLFKHERLDDAKLHLTQFQELFEGQDESAKNTDPEMLEQAAHLRQALAGAEL